MKKRTLILASLCAVFLVIAIIQQIVLNRNPVKMVTFDENPDKITITNSSINITLQKSGEDWILADSGLKALPNSCDLISKYLKEIKILDTVGKTGNSVVEENYDLTDLKSTVASAFKGEKLLRKIKIGKKTSTSGQTYITLDDSNKIYLVSGDYQGTIVKTEEALISKQIFSVPVEKINSVNVKTPRKNWGFVKNVEDDSWIFSDSEKTSEYNAEKVDQWISSISYLDCEKFLPKDTIIPRVFSSEVTISTDDDEITVSIYDFEIEDGKIVATCNKTDQKFAVSKYVSEKFVKDLESLK